MYPGYSFTAILFIAPSRAKRARCARAFSRLSSKTGMGDSIRAMLGGGDPDELLPATGLSLRERRRFRQVLELGPPKRRD